VENVGEGEMRLIGAEIRKSPAVTSPEALDAPGHVLSLERERLRAYELSLAPGESTGDIEYRFSSLTVILTIASLLIRHPDGTERSAVHAPGDVIWQPGPTLLSITNIGEQPCRAAVGEWR
jgi:hypothetical protein